MRGEVASGQVREVTHAYYVRSKDLNPSTTLIFRHVRRFSVGAHAAREPISMHSRDPWVPNVEPCAGWLTAVPLSHFADPPKLLL